MFTVLVSATAINIAINILNFFLNRVRCFSEPVSKKNLDEWAQKFPSVDIEFELLKMLDWLQANQKRKKDYKAFFRNWLRKASNSIEKEVQDVYRYIYGCSTDQSCKHQESEYKDMVIFCNKCNSQKKIIKSVRA
jgi:hypothetical protein